METEDPLVFERFVLWLYTNQIIDETLGYGFNIIIDLWLFADRRGIPLLMNDMIDAFHAEIGYRWVIPTKCIDKIYENTIEKSALRRMFIWSVSHITGENMFKGDHADRWPREALLDMLRAVLSKQTPVLLSKKEYKMASMCPAYHVHEEGV